MSCQQDGWRGREAEEDQERIVRLHGMDWGNICVGNNWLYTRYEAVDRHDSHCDMAWTVSRRYFAQKAKYQA